MIASPHDLRLSLLAWYDIYARTLPWRIAPAKRALGVVPDPYRVWLSEIMLQQTTIASVKPYFERFLTAFPTLEALAKSPLDGVLSLWAGLGYYARGRNLHACAIALVQAGGFPKTPEALSAFPGIGPYTAAAIASIAFDYPSVPVDGNVERVLSRLLHIEAVLPAGKAAFRAAAATFADRHRPGDFAQALMDLGSTLCTPRNPSCAICPWSNACQAYRAGDVHAYPKKLPKKIKPIRYGVAFVHINDDGILVARRPDSGLLGGMLEVPGTIWRDEPWAEVDAVKFAPIPLQDWQVGAPVRHIFTHFDLRLAVYFAVGQGSIASIKEQRVSTSDLSRAALPTVMMKAITAAISAATR